MTIGFLLLVLSVAVDVYLVIELRFWRRLRAAQKRDEARRRQFREGQRHRQAQLDLTNEPAHDSRAACLLLEELGGRITARDELDP
jgi:hypothetical protein